MAMLLLTAPGCYLSIYFVIAFGNNMLIWGPITINAIAQTFLLGLCIYYYFTNKGNPDVVLSNPNDGNNESESLLYREGSNESNQSSINDYNSIRYGSLAANKDAINVDIVTENDAPDNTRKRLFSKEELGWRLKEHGVTEKELLGMTRFERIQLLKEKEGSIADGPVVDQDE